MSTVSFVSGRSRAFGWIHVIKAERVFLFWNQSGMKGRQADGQHERVGECSGKGQVGVGGARFPRCSVCCEQCPH